MERKIHAKIHSASDPSSRGPLHLTATENMKVEMINGLSAVTAIVDDQTKPAVQIQLLRHLLAHRHQVTQ